MTSFAVRILIAGLLGLASMDSSRAQNLEQTRRDAGQAEWAQVSPQTYSCIDDRLRRAHRSMRALIRRGIGPTDTRIARIVGDCSAGSPSDAEAATPSFDCRVVTYPDERTICGDPELARLDRDVVEAYHKVRAREGTRMAKSISEPLLERRHACESDADCIKRSQLAAIAAFQARRAPARTATPAEPDAPVYAVDDIRLGSVVADGPDLHGFDCMPSLQYPEMTACQRQTSERSRRRRASVSTSLLHAADGSVVYVGRSTGQVSIDDGDVDGEIARLSATFGNATLLPMSDSRGVRSGVIASWGAVRLQPIEPERLKTLAAGADDRPGLLIDQIGDPQRSASSGLPVYRLDGGPGYVWAASWSGRGRGSLRMIAIDPSQLPGAVKPAAKPFSQPAGAATAPPATQDGATVSRETSAQASPKSIDAEQPKASAPKAISAPQPDAPMPVRVVGPPNELRPTAPAKAATPAPTPSAPRDGNGLVMLLTAIIVVLLGAISYMYVKSNAHSSAAGRAEASPTSTPTTATTPTTLPEAVTNPGSDRMDLQKLVPVESPESIAASPSVMPGPQAADTILVPEEVPPSPPKNSTAPS